MPRNKPIVVNFLAGPSAGKSTSAAAVFAYLKNKDCNVELVTEYAKRICYEQTTIKLRNQLYITAKQYKLIKDVADYGVKLILTDSPIVLGKIYSNKHHYYKELCAMIDALNNDFENINVFVQRVKKYNPSGRLQTAEESDKISEYLRHLVDYDYIIEGKPEDQEFLGEQLYMKYGDRIAV
jgi:hypothetical protein